MDFWKNLLAGFLAIIVAFIAFKVLMWFLGFLFHFTLGVLALFIIGLFALPLYFHFRKMLSR